MRVLGLPCLAVALSACTTTATTYCPPIRDYSPEFNASLADEAVAAPADAAWPGAILDYIALRDRIRAACP